MRKFRNSPLKNSEDSDPLSVVVNLFDVAMVFAVCLMVSMVMNMNMTELFTDDNFSVVKNFGKENMEIITKENGKIVKYKAKQSSQNDSKQSMGKRVGVAYQLEDGNIVYYPE